MSSIWSLYIFFNSFIILCYVNYANTDKHEESCQVFDKGFQYFGTKTPYRAVENYEDENIKYEGCHPTKIVGIFRHGARTPSTKIVHKMKKRLKKIQKKIKKLDSSESDSSASDSSASDSLASNGGKLCEYDLNRIKNWKLQLKVDDEEKLLVHEGGMEMFKLAERYRNRFPSLLKQTYSNNTFYFRFTESQRTKESAKFFTKGLFGEEASKHVWFPQPILKDPVLRFYKLCTKWLTEVDKNPETTKELDEFLKTKEIEEMVHRVSTKIGLNNKLNYEDVRLIYLTCAFETASNRSSQQSPWCAPFSERDLKTIDYTDDLETFWESGYGYEINYKQACPLINNIFSNFLATDGPTSILYFTHSGAILKTLAHLGLYKDDKKLTHDIEQKIRESRKWKSSKIDTFSANIVFTLFQCDEELKVLLLHQEKVIRFPACPESDLCSFKTLENVYSSTTSCDFSGICGLKDDDTGR